MAELTPRLNPLLRPDVIDAVRSWFATLSGIAASVFSFVIVILALVFSQASAGTILITALVLTHIEAILCLFYLQRLSLESLKGKIGVVELEMETHGDQPQVQQLVKTKAYGGEAQVSTSGPTSTGTDEAGLLSVRGGSDTSTSTGAVRTGPNEAGQDSNLDPKV